MTTTTIAEQVAALRRLIGVPSNRSSQHTSSAGQVAVSDHALDAAEDTSALAALRIAEQRIPPRFRASVADEPRIIAWADEIAAAATAGSTGLRNIGSGPSLLISGPTGTGKTFGAYGALRRLIAAGCGLRWAATTHADLFGEMRHRSASEAEQTFRTLSRTPLLILDDLGSAASSPWTEEITFRLVDHRYTHMLPTVMTTNLPTAELRGRLGERVVDRLREMAWHVVLSGASRRVRIAS